MLPEFEEILREYAPDHLRMLKGALGDDAPRPARPVVLVVEQRRQVYNDNRQVVITPPADNKPVQFVDGEWREL